MSDQTPEERLEWLRFSCQEGETMLDWHRGQTAWMQEVEEQVANLRKRLNELPNEYARKGPSW